MTIWHEKYRGYQISYQSGDWYALIMPPGGESPLDLKPMVEPNSGRVELRHRTHATIDGYISAHRV